MFSRLQLKLLLIMGTRLARVFPILLVCTISLASVNHEASAEVYSSQTDSNPTMKADLEFFYQVNANDFSLYTNWQALHNDIRFFPVFTDNNISAYRIIFIKEESLFSFYNLEVGDEITHVNNKPVKDIDYLITALKCEDGTTLKFSIKTIQGYRKNYIFSFNLHSG